MKIMLNLLNVEPNNYCERARKIISRFAHVTESNMDRHQLLNCINKYDILITRLAMNIDAEVLRQATKLKIIVTATTGLDHIDLKTAKDKNIEVLSLKGQTKFLETITATAEHTWGMLLTLMRNIYYAHNDVLSGHWQRDKFRGTELRNKVLGIIGYGRLGKMVAAYGKAFQMDVYAYDPFSDDESVKKLPLDELLSISDVLTFHLPLNENTVNFMGEVEFSRLKPNVVIVNTSRGEIISEKVLLEYLKKNKIAGAALDVLSGEYSYRSGISNWPEDDLLVRYAMEHQNLILTPHIGGATIDSMQNTEIFMAEALEKYVMERKLNIN